MQTTFDVEIFAIAVGVEGSCGGIGQVSHHLEIVTETDILYLPVIASILFKKIEDDAFLSELAHLNFDIKNYISRHSSIHYLHLRSSPYINATYCSFKLSHEARVEGLDQESHIQDL